MAITVLDDWTFVDDDPNSQTVTVSAGTAPRVTVLFYGSPSHDIDAFGWSITTILWGDQAPTATYKCGDGTDNAPRYFAIWDETATAARSDNTVDWTATTITSEFFGWACYEGASQTGLDSLVNDSTNYSTNQSTSTLTTTSNSGDRIIVGGGLGSASREVSDWDTLTEKYDSVVSPRKACLGEGNGGDGSTVVTNTTFTIPNFASIVLQQEDGGVVQQAMHHYRNHGKIL